jgi:hypothetical protein
MRALRHPLPATEVAVRCSSARSAMPNYGPQGCFLLYLREAGRTTV